MDLPSPMSDRPLTWSMHWMMASSQAPSWLVTAIAIPRTWRLVEFTRLGAFLVFVASSAWTIFLGLLNAVPNAAANYLMNTTQFDDGDFWQLAEPEYPLTGVTLAGLAMIATIYAYLAITVLLPPRPNTLTSTSKLPVSAHISERVESAVKSGISTLPPRIQVSVADVAASYFELVNQHGKNRKAWNLVMEIIEITFQTFTLHDMLVQGLDARLIHAYIALMLVNCVYCFYHITIAWKQRAFHEMVSDAILDVVFAVVFPALVLVHAINAFRGGLRAMWIRQQFFPAEVYERRSRIYGDPTRINAFVTAFDSLRITTATDLIVTIGFNLLTCFRWRRIMATIRLEQRRTRPILTAARCTRANILPAAEVNNIPIDTKEERRLSHRKGIKNAIASNINVTPVLSRVIPAYVGVFFLLFGAGVALFASIAISKSTDACSTHESCTLFSYQWFPGAPHMLCPCLVFINGDLTSGIARYAKLPDASAQLRDAAEAGTLRTIHLVNRGLQGTLPKTLQACTKLRHLILVNSDISEIPSWATYSFRNLQYLHVEGRYSEINLKRLPADLFSQMASLRTLYLSRHHLLEQFPPLMGLSKLRTLYLGHLEAVSVLPSFEHTPRLETLALVDLTHVYWLPDLALLAHTLSSLFVYNAPLCCSGFLSMGVCDLTQPSCIDYFPDFSWITCYPNENQTAEDPRLVIGSASFPLISDASRAVLAPFLASKTACKDVISDLLFGSYDDACQGMLYRKCMGGICAYTAVGAIDCVKDDAIIAMRRVEIQEGLACNKTEEAWLGCAV